MGNLLSLDPKIHGLRTHSKKFGGLSDSDGMLIDGGCGTGYIHCALIHSVYPTHG